MRRREGKRHASECRLPEGELRLAYRRRLRCRSNSRAPSADNAPKEPPPVLHPPPPPRSRRMTVNPLSWNVAQISPEVMPRSFGKLGLAGAQSTGWLNPAPARRKYWEP